LVKEADDLLHATRELLRAIGIVHLNLDASHEVSGDDVGGDHKARLLDAYADAGMMWAKVIGCSLALAESLMDQGRWNDLQRLAGFLDLVGEDVAASDIRKRADAAARRASQRRLSHITYDMTEDEIASAFEALQECDEDVISYHLLILANAMIALPGYTRHYGPSYHYTPAYAERQHSKPSTKNARERLSVLASSFHKFQQDKRRGRLACRTG